MPDIASTTVPDAASTPSAPPLSDAFPVLLGPVRVEYRFTDTELLVRVFPDDWQVDDFEEKLTAQESDHALRYWRSYWEAGGDHDERLAAWRVLASHSGPGRARYIVRTRRPLNPGDEPHRTHADQVILVVATDDPIAAGDRGAATTYWRAVYRSGGAPNAVHAADQALNNAIGQARAAKVRARPPAHLDRDPRVGDRAQADVTVAFCDMPKVAAADTKPSTWTQPARARLLPDAFMLLGYANGQPVLNVTGKPVPADLVVGPDPGAPDGDQFRSQNGSLHVPAALKWLFDFGTAVSSGMGFRVPLTDAIRGGLDRLIVLGLRNRVPATSKLALEQLILHQADSRAGFRLLPQGTATNNTGTTPPAFGSGDGEGETFAAQLLPAQTVATPMPPVAVIPPKTDGQWLAELLGIDPAVVTDVPGADGTDQIEARAMNTALWPATWGYHLGTMLNPMFGTDAIDATRTFFTRYVSGRGPVPAFRVGKQPYGVLITTAFSRLAWADTDPVAPHRRKLHAVLTAMADDWNDLTADVPHLGAIGDPHATLLGILGLHPASAEFYQRYAQSAEDYFNRLNLGGLGDSVPEALTQLGIQQSVRTLLTRLGYSDGAPDPDLSSRLFTGRQHPLKGPLIDDRPLSEDAPIRAYTDGGANYLDWLATNAQAAFDIVRQEAGFTGGTPPTALLYLLARHAVLNGYFEAALRLAAAAHSLTDQAVVGERREAPFVHISLRTTATESRFGWLYAPDPAVTGDPVMLVVDYIQAHLGQDPATQQLAEQLNALAPLSKAPTARLERALVEHLDICTYRLDAWRLGLASEKLFGLRYPASGTPVTGVHLGAFGYLEEVRPRATQPTPVTLTGELAQVFTPPGAPPLVHDPANQGFIHAPSMPQATTSALLRSGYLANATPDNPGTLAVNLSSERVRTALTFIDGIRAGQSLGALLGYRLERGMHDRHDIAETDKFISALRQAFPLVANKLPDTADAGQPIDALEARNVVDGLALIRYVTRTGPATYPFGLSGLPPATPDQATVIDSEVQRLIEINDSLADLSVAEGVYQTAAGNPERAKSAMDAYTNTGNPPDPQVVRTPVAGKRLNHRVSVQLRDGLPPTASPASGVPMTPRGNGDPAVDRWLADLLPKPGDVAVQVVWADPVTAAPHSTVVTQSDIGLQPIDLLWALRPTDQAAMTDLDDRIVGRVMRTQNLRGDTELAIRYTDRIHGKITFFELSPLVDALRQLLLAARAAKPSDYIVPADGATLAPDRDADVDLPRNRPQAVRDALNAFRTALAGFVHDIGQPLTDPVAHRQQLLSGVDTFLTQYADLLVTASSCGLVRSGWGEMVLWRRQRFGEVLAVTKETADRMTASLAAANAKISAYDALPSDTPADARFALLQQAERLLTTKPTSPRPDTPQHLRAIVGQRRTDFTHALSALTAIAHTMRGTVSGLLSDVQGLLPLTQFDATGLDLTPIQDTVVVFCQGLLARAQNLLDELTGRITAVDAALAQYDAAAAGPDRVTAATAAIRAGLGPDALATSEFGISTDLGQTWQKVLTASRQGALTGHLNRDFPVDDWLHGLARVRPRLALWERITLLSDAIGQHEPDLIPVQFPFATGDPWLGLEIPATFSLNGDRLLHTTHYAAPFDPGSKQCALLFDEWTETIPAITATTGIAAHYDRPGTQPPQTMLLVAPPAATGTWQLDDLVAAISETMAMARARAVEPGQLDPTAYAQLLPATVLSAGARPISIATDLSVNNELTPSASPFRPARGLPMVRPPVISDMRAALADRAFPTVTVWNRVEGRPRTTEFDRALKAEVRDALWMLARQWQLGEFRGEDTGSPVSATYHLRTATATRYRPQETEPGPLPGELPLEAVAGRRAVPFRFGTDLLGLDLRLVMGRRWTKLMNDAINPPPVRQTIIDRWRVRLPDPTSEADTTLVANPDVWATTQAVAGRSMDGYELYVRLKGGGHSYDDTSGINNHWKQELDKLNARFIAWFEDLIAQPGGTPEAYDPARLEHRFALGVPESTGETVLSAAEYPGGTLDWYGFSYDQSGTTLGTSGGPATATSVTRTIMPGPVQYSGMPNPRWWMFEDGKTDFGAVTADSTDLVKTLFLEFALVFSDDWFLLPCDLVTGALARLDGLMFTDVFGQRNWIEPAGSGTDDDWQRWAMYNLDIADGDGTGAPVPASLGLFLPSAAPGAAEGPPSEYVLMVRDEVANMVWGIERTVPLATGATQVGEEAARQTLAFRKRLRPSPPPGPPIAAVAYQAQNTVPENWIPFIPVHVPGSNREIQLQRGAMPRVLDGVVISPVKVQPRTTLLRPGLDVFPAGAYFVHEEEVPRVGTRLTVAFSRMRRPDGAPVVWLSVDRSTGRGEAHSGLEWDSLVSTPTPV